VSIFPVLKDGHPVAAVTLTKGDEWKTVSDKFGLTGSPVRRVQA